MAVEIPPKIPRDSYKPSEGASQTTVQTGEKDGTPDKLLQDSQVIPKESTETGEKTPEKDGTPENLPQDSHKPPEKAKAVLSMDQLMMLGAKKFMMLGAKKLPSMLEEIPDYLYKPGTKRYEIAKLIIFEGIQDPSTLAERTNSSEKTVYNVRSDIKKVVGEVMQSQGKSREIVENRERNFREPSREPEQLAS